MLHTITALTLDLDDTLWPIRPTLVAAEQVLQDWLAQHAPRTAAAFDVDTMLALRAQVARERPQDAHDLTALRLETIRRALAAQGDDPGLAEAAFETFFAARHDVAWYEDVMPGLQRLAARYPLVALSNGNADIARVGLGSVFRGAVSARGHGAAKPAASIFHAACRLVDAQPHQVLHLGDDLRLDVQAALDAGLQAGWICRPDHAQHGQAHDVTPAGAHRWATLADVADALGC